MFKKLPLKILAFTIISTFLIIIAAFFLVRFNSLKEKKITYPELSGFVNDEADMFTDEQEEYITDLVGDFENKTANTIVILTVDSLKGENIDSYANYIFNRRGIGNEEKNNGILILLSKRERQCRIEVGYGLERKVDNGTAARISKEKMTPWFSAGYYETGITEGIKALIEKIGET